MSEPTRYEKRLLSRKPRITIPKNARPKKPPPEVSREEAQRLLERHLPNKSRKRGLRATP